MSKTSSRRTSRLTTPVMITFVVVAALLLGLTVTSVVNSMTRGDDPVVVNAVLTGQSMEVNRTTGLDVIRFKHVRSPLSSEDVEDTFDTCMADEARQYLASIAGEGTSLDIEIEAYANAPNGELWAEIYRGGQDVGAEMVEAGYAVVAPDEIEDQQRIDALLASQEKARHDGRGIFSTDADCTLPSQVNPVLEEFENLPSSPQANDVAELTRYLGEMNSIRSRAQRTLAMLSAIPSADQDESVAALAWGDAKQEYIDLIETHLTEIRGLIEDAQAKRANLQGINVPPPELEPAPEPEPEPEAPEEPEPAEEPAPEAEPQAEVEPAQQPAEEAPPVEEAQPEQQGAENTE